ncbi:MAG: hypothetical protein CVT92_11920 [Bacteroidetes bacterium HGW-Bacteroidetes-1]|jgi:hypothetical protein|nr:MAG: hypothetical protein CVT92_11920 [Bacteroidetes bacterium HGW-Bacteroidetes-1]
MNHIVTTTLFSTAFFPPVSYLAALIKADHIFIENYETYPKQTFRNRCIILSSNGLQRLTVPIVKTEGNHTKTNEIQIVYKENWQQKHLRAIESSYNTSPYYYHYKHQFIELFSQKFSTLTDLNIKALELILKLLKLQKTIFSTENYEKYPSDKIDLRNVFSPKRRPQNIQFETYYQVFNDRFAFQPDLSVLDLLFNTGPASLDYLLRIGRQISFRVGNTDMVNIE